MHHLRWHRRGDLNARAKAPDGFPRKFVQSVLDGTAPREPNGCILWPYGVTGRGYPLVEWDDASGVVGHSILEHFAGPRPSTKHVMGHAPHAVCGHRHCVAPEHLSWQTPSENTRQAIDVDRTLGGERHHEVTVSDTEVRAAIARVKAGESQTAVAAELGVRQSTVGSWVHGKTRRTATT